MILLLDGWFHWCMFRFIFLVVLIYWWFAVFIDGWMNLLINVLMNSWTDGYFDWWMDSLMDGWNYSVGLMYWLMNKFNNVYMYLLMHGRIYWWMYGLFDECTYLFMDGCISRWMCWFLPGTRPWMGWSLTGTHPWVGWSTIIPTWDSGMIGLRTEWVNIIANTKSQAEIINLEKPMLY